MRTRLLPLAVALALAACKQPAAVRPTAPAATGAPGVRASGPATVASPTATPGLSTLTPPPAVVTGNGVISNNGAGLTGKVKAPASLVSDHGAGRRLLGAPEQVPVAGALVAFADASGKVLGDARGKPITALTDAQGNYKLETPLPNNNVVVTVVLPGGSGTLEAIALKAAKTADLDLVSSLTTGYIMETYVKPQADPIKTLDKLPAGVEADTRAKAADAFAKGSVAVPDKLTRQTATAAVAELRKADSSLDGQLETVKRLLVAAGQSDLGEGQPATSVLLRGVNALAELPDGTLYISASQDGRIWRMGKDGILHRAAGGGAMTATDDLAATNARLDRVTALAVDGDALRILETRHLWRLGADGKLHDLWHLPGEATSPGPVAHALARKADGKLWILTSGVWKDDVLQTPAAIYQAGQDQPLHSFSDADSRLLLRTGASGLGPDGVWRLGLDREGAGIAFNASGLTAPTHPSLETALASLDPATFALTTQVDPKGKERWTVDQLGNVVTLTEPAERLGQAGSNVSFLQGAFLYTLAPAWREPDGAQLLGARSVVGRFKPGQFPVIAGTTQLPTSGTADTIAFDDLVTMAASPNGRLAVLEKAGRYRLWSIAPDGQAKVVHAWAAFGEPDWTPEDGDFEPQAVRVRDDGTIYLLDGSFQHPGKRLWQVDPAGTAMPIYPAGGQDPDKVDPKLADYVPMPNGDAYELMGQVPESDNQMAYFIRRLSAGGGAPVDTPLNNIDADVREPVRLVVINPDLFYVGGENGLHRFTRARGLEDVDPEQKVQAVARDIHLNDPGYWVPDSKGRIFGSTGLGIWRFDPASGTLTTITSKVEGGEAFNGTGTDTSTGIFLAAPALDAKDTLYFVDPENHQIKQLPAAQQPN